MKRILLTSLLAVTLFMAALSAQTVHNPVSPAGSDNSFDSFGESDITFENSGPTTVPTFDVSDCTNDSPIVVTTATAHGVSNTEWVVIENVVGNTACNGIFEVASVASTTVTLVGTTGNGAYISGGVLGGFKVVAGTWTDGNLGNFTASAAGLLTYTASTLRQFFVIHSESTNLVTDPGNPICHYAIMHNGDVSPKTLSERNLPSTSVFGSSTGVALLQLANGDTLQLHIACIEPTGAASYDVMVGHAALAAFTI